MTVANATFWQYARFNHAPPIFEKFNPYLICQLARGVRERNALRAHLRPLGPALSDAQFDDWFNAAQKRIQNVIEVAEAYGVKLSKINCA